MPQRQGVMLGTAFVKQASPASPAKSTPATWKHHSSDFVAKAEAQPKHETQTILKYLYVNL